MYLNAFKTSVSLQYLQAHFPNISPQYEKSTRSAITFPLQPTYHSAIRKTSKIIAIM